MATYSFLNISCTLVGPSVSLNLGDGASVAEEGITFEPIDDKNIMTVGADGKVMHSLLASRAGLLKVRFLKTAVVNSKLQQAYNVQTRVPATHGQMIMVVRDSSRGDIITAKGVAFKRQPDIGYTKEGGMLEWQFDASEVNILLGVGTPSLT
jgi:hypothetical protein